jgi:hypothetical protein
MATTITDVARELSKKQETLVNSLVENSPLLAILPFEEATHHLFHAYEDVQEITAGDFIDIDGDVPDVGIESALLRTDLSIIAGKDIAGIDKVNQYGGLSKYTEKRMPSVIESTGMKTDRTLYYNLFRQNAIDYGNVQEFATPSTGSTGYSITAIRFQRGVCTGLFDPTGFGDGKILDTKFINKGEEFLDGDKFVQGWHLRGYTGGLVASSKNVAAIVNIDIDEVGTDTTVPDIIDEMLLQCRSGMGDTVLVMHPRVKNKLRAFKGEKLQINVAEKSFSRNIDVWEGVPIIEDYNLLEGTEALVALPS